MASLSPASFIAEHSFQIAVGDQIDITSFRRDLEAANYQHVETVYQHGEFTIRGGLIDVYPMGSEQALRIELFDIEVEQIKTFDIETQRSQGNLQDIALLPAREVPLDEEALELFEENWYAHFPDISLKQTHFYQDLKEKISFSGIESYLPLFFSQAYYLCVSYTHLTLPTICSV